MASIDIALAQVHNKVPSTVNDMNNVNTDTDFKWVMISDVKCIVWNNLLQDDAAERRKRKSLKDITGGKYLNTPMLDTKKSSSNSLEYCDCIIKSNHLDTWMSVSKTKYSDLKHTSTQISGGSKTVISNPLCNKILVTISCWPKHSKMMIQPGQRDEKNLLKWIRDLTKLAKQEITKAGDPPSKATDELHISDFPPLVNLISHNSMEVKAKEHPTKTSKNAFTFSVTSPANDTTPDEPMKSLYSEITSRKQTIIINEALCFIQNKIDRVPHALIPKICCDYYSAEAICRAKDILYQNVDSGKRRLKRKGPDKSKQDIIDIIKILLELKNPSPVKFVASNLADLPPLSWDNMDVTKLYQEWNP